MSSDRLVSAARAIAVLVVTTADAAAGVVIVGVVEAIAAGDLSLADTVEVGPEADWQAVGGSSIGGHPEDDPDDRGLVEGDRIGLEDLL